MSPKPWETKKCFYSETSFLIDFLSFFCFRDQDQNALNKSWIWRFAIRKVFMSISFRFFALYFNLIGREVFIFAMHLNSVNDPNKSSFFLVSALGFNTWLHRVMFPNNNNKQKFRFSNYGILSFPLQKPCSKCLWKIFNLRANF